MRITYPFPSIETWITQTLAEGNRREGYGYYGDTPLGDTWGIVYSFAVSADGSELGESNYRTLVKWLEESYPDDFTDETFGGFFGRVDHIMIRLVNEDGSLSDVAKFVYDKLIDLDNYPVWDEEDFSQRELDSQFESVKSEVSQYLIEGIDPGESAATILWSLSNDDNMDFPENYVNPIDSIAKGIEIGHIAPDTEFPAYIERWLWNRFESDFKRFKL
jgi:hypothetical protein